MLALASTLGAACAGRNIGVSTVQTTSAQRDIIVIDLASSKTDYFFYLIDRRTQLGSFRTSGHLVSTSAASRSSSSRASASSATLKGQNTPRGSTLRSLRWQLHARAKLGSPSVTTPELSRDWHFTHESLSQFQNRALRSRHSRCAPSGAAHSAHIVRRRALCTPRSAPRSGAMLRRGDCGNGAQRCNDQATSAPTGWRRRRHC